MQFIQVYEKVFNDDFCQKVIDYYNAAEQGGMTVNRQDKDKVLKTEKQDNAFFIPHLPLQHTQQDIMEKFTQVLWGKCYKEYADKFDILKSFNQHRSYTLKVQKTRPGEGYHIWHSEITSKENSERLLTWTIYLNDDFEAGETEFLYQHYRYKPSKGDVIIFPAGFTHTHRGNPPIGGDKYIITGWIEF